MAEEGQFEGGPLKKVSVASLLAADSPRIDGESAEHIRLLAESDAALPPIAVHRPTMRVIDGMHRLRAAALRGEEEIEVRFFDGSTEDAFVLSVELNVRHGLPLTRADRTAAVMRIIRSHSDWSNRLIASVTGVSDKTVASIRRRSTAELPQSNTRTGRDGRVRRLDPEAARRHAGQVVSERPEASLREIAAEAGVSVSTARDVRERMRSGSDPVRPRQRAARAQRVYSEKQLPPSSNDVRSGSDQGRVWSVSGTAGAELTQVLNSLRADPSLRFTEAGRAILRLLDAQSKYAKDWVRLAEGIPSHRMGALAKVARGCSESWLYFAQQLEQRDSSIHSVD